ncbi:hydrolase [Streptomyces spiroverticillatus]|uniref:Hydrolase n=1 Tax=Streptomyces finlayi TaxID=67296 RepID=A0A918WYN6_9ACTN|nr:HAD family phosphatase [Streptomyces finlayi]GHA09839.1 hydrolase [Streptomyces spiroverticillatus]GHC96008.1 hydrolase [Streptomyces finlayi]
MTLPALPRPAALLCDMDGTLVDTEHQWLEVVAALLEEHGIEPAPEVLAPFAGAAIDTAAALFADRHGVLGTAERLDREFTELVAAGVSVQPGAMRLLDRARELGIPVALVTASERKVADLVLKGLGAERFAASITQGETERGKPHPDPYLAAARALGADPAECLAVEDTPTGAQAALAAGCRLLAVPSVPGIEPGPRTYLYASLEDVHIADS